MKLELLNEKAKKIWKQFTSESANNILRLELNLYKKLLEIFQAGSFYYFIFNFQLIEFELVSKEIFSVLGYYPSEVNMQFLMDKVHPEDQMAFLAFEAKIVDFFSNLPVDKLMKYKVRYDLRIKKKDGTYARLLHQVVVAEHDGKGKALRTLGIHTDITYLKQEGKPVLSILGMDGEPSYENIPAEPFLTQKRNVLTEREKQVLRQVILGKPSKEIACVLNIKKQTVDTHRKNMLHKTGCKSISELIGKSIRYAWI